MKARPVLSGLTALLLLAVFRPVAGLAQESRPGSYASAAVTNQEVCAAAAFAIKAQQAALQDKGGRAGKLELVTILQAEQQVVAGMNYRLKLKVKLDGKEKTAEAVVWWQAWRKAEPYKLTSWKWE
jgi:hypothetical protein